MTTNVFLVRWGGGWTERSDAGSIADVGRIEAPLGLGAINSLDEAQRVADGQLAEFARARTQTDIAILPIDSTDTPYRAFNVGDVVTLEGVPHRVLSIAVSEDPDTGRAIYVPTLNDDIILTGEERIFQALRKMVNGTLGGRSKVAQPVVPRFIPRGSAADVAQPVYPLGVRVSAPDSGGAGFTISAGTRTKLIWFGDDFASEIVNATLAVLLIRPTGTILTSSPTVTGGGFTWGLTGTHAITGAGNAAGYDALLLLYRGYGPPTDFSDITFDLGTTSNGVDLTMLTMFTYVTDCVSNSGAVAQYVDAAGEAEYGSAATNGNTTTAVGVTDGFGTGAHQPTFAASGDSASKFVLYAAISEPGTTEGGLIGAPFYTRWRDESPQITFASALTEWIPL